MTRFLKATAIAMLLSAQLSSANDMKFEFTDSDYSIAVCKWMSLLAKDIMEMRQSGETLSDAQAMASDRVNRITTDMIVQLLKSKGIDFDKLAKALADERQVDTKAKLEPIVEKTMVVIEEMQLESRVTQLAAKAYEVPIQSSPEERRSLVDGIEKGVLNSCAPGLD